MTRREYVALSLSRQDVRIKNVQELLKRIKSLKLSYRCLGRIK